MEPEIALYLRKIVWSLSAIMVWMLVNIFFGIQKGYMLFEEGHTFGSVIFYLWLSGSFYALFKLYKRHWRQKQEETTYPSTKP
jgi:hypothetical protein